MKRILLISVFVVLIALPAFGQGAKFGLGGFAGLNLPLIQDDQKSGSTFGLRARLKVLPFIVAEPNIVFTKWGKPDPVDGIDLGIDGSKVSAIGLDATLGGLPGAGGINPFFVVGVASYKIKNDDTGYDESNLGLSGGLGIGIGVSPQIDLDIRGMAIVAPQDNGSKKAIAITGGIVYNFGIGR